MKPKILALAGSMRKDSFNKKLIRIGAKELKKAGAEVTLIDLNDYRLPLYHGDEEEAHGLPDKAKELKKLFIEHDGFLFSSPEYNSSVSGVFKNAIDWVSRPEKTDAYYLVAYKKKVAAIMSASPGALGGLRGLVHLRSLLENIYVFVLPDQVTVPHANEAFDDNDNLKDAAKFKKVSELAFQLTDIISKFKSGAAAS